MPRTPLRMPKMSMTMEEGELVGWKVAVGDPVTEGQVLCEVLTDKVDMEVEAPATGTLVGIDVSDGETVPVGTPIAWIETESESLMDDLFGPPDPRQDGATDPAAPAAPLPASAPVTPGAASPDPEPVEPVGPAAGGGIVPAIPAARRLAADHGIALTALAGTGPDGAVMVSDVRAVLDAAAPAPAAAAPPAAAVATAVAPVTPVGPVGPVGPVAPVATGPATGPAAATADDWLARTSALLPRAGEGLSAPGAALWRDVVLGPQVPTTEQLLARVVTAVSSALATSGPPAVRERPRVALLVPTPAGTVPVTLVAAHTQAPDQVLTDVTTALSQARTGTLDVRFLAPPDVTVTHLEQVDRVVVPVRPGSLIALGVGSAAPRVIATENGVGVRTTVALSATADVRVADPASVAALLATVAAALEAA